MHPTNLSLARESHTNGRFAGGLIVVLLVEAVDVAAAFGVDVPVAPAETRQSALEINKMIRNMRLLYRKIK